MGRREYGKDCRIPYAKDADVNVGFERFVNASSGQDSDVDNSGETD